MTGTGAHTLQRKKQENGVRERGAQAPSIAELLHIRSPRGTQAGHRKNFLTGEGQ